MQVFFPLAPGIESIWEPFQEEVEERVQEVQRQLDVAMDGRTPFSVSICCMPLSCLVVGAVLISGPGLKALVSVVCNTLGSLVYCQASR